MDENHVEVTETDFYSALESLVPSVSEAEIARYLMLRNFLTANNDKLPASLEAKPEIQASPPQLALSVDK